MLGKLCIFISVVFRIRVITEVRILEWEQRINLLKLVWISYYQNLVNQFLHAIKVLNCGHGRFLCDPFMLREIADKCDHSYSRGDLRKHEVVAKIMVALYAINGNFESI